MSAILYFVDGNPPQVSIYFLRKTKQ